MTVPDKTIQSTTLSDGDLTLRFLNLGGAVTTLTAPDRFQQDRAFWLYFILE